MRTWIAAAVLSAATAYGQQIPRPSPDYTITIPGSGKQVTVGQYKGKVIALEFLLTTCPHCQTASRVLAKLEKELGPKGFQPLGVAINERPDIDGFRQMTGATYPIGISPRESVYGYLQHSIMQPNLLMPQLVFVDRNGQIRAQYAGDSDFFDDKNEEKNMRDMVTKLLAEGAPAAKKPAPAAAPAKKKKVS